MFSGILLETKSVNYGLLWVGAEFRSAVFTEDLRGSRLAFAIFANI